MNGEGFPRPSQHDLPPHQPDAAQQYGSHIGGAEFGGPTPTEAHSPDAHSMQAPGTEMMRLSADSQPIAYDPVSPAERTERALGDLHVGESTVVWVPREGNKRVTFAGAKDGKLIYHWEEASATQPVQPMRPPASTPPRRASPPPPHNGPIGSADFGPRGGPKPVQEAAPYAQPGHVYPQGNRPSKEYTGRYYVDTENILSDGSDDGVESEIFGNERILRDYRNDPSPEPPPKPEASERVVPKQDIVTVEQPGIEKITPDAVQPDAREAGEPEAEKDLADQLLADTAPPLAEMSEEDRPDTMAVRRPGAAAAAQHAEKTAPPEEEDEPAAIQGVAQNVPPAEGQELNISEVLGVVPEGERPPDTDYMPGGSPSRLYRR